MSLKASTNLIVERKPPRALAQAVLVHMQPASIITMLAMTDLAVLEGQNSVQGKNTIMPSRIPTTAPKPLQGLVLSALAWPGMKLRNIITTRTTTTSTQSLDATFCTKIHHKVTKILAVETTQPQALALLAQELLVIKRISILTGALTDLARIIPRETRTILVIVALRLLPGLEPWELVHMGLISFTRDARLNVSRLPPLLAIPIQDSKSTAH
jgi:hypothetical protein